jgi:protein-S-isoprenylcysteine O-methyltransferase Ste14
MSRVLVLVYGVAAYLAFFAVFAASVAFVGNVGPLRRIDDGEPGAVAVSLAIDLALVALFGIPHSVMARPRFKQGLVRVIPRAAERSTYVLVASVSLGLLLWQWRPLPMAVWSVDASGVRAALWAVSGIGVLLVVYSTFLTDHFDLFGLRQVWLHARGRPYTPVPFKERGLYRVVRHPMMLGVLLWFWSTPTMSVGHLVFTAGMSVYIVVGIALEERDLARNLGEAYVRYRARVGRFLPRARVTTPPG